MCRFFRDRHFNKNLAHFFHLYLSYCPEVNSRIAYVISNLKPTHIIENRIQCYVSTKDMLARSNEIKSEYENYSSDDHKDPDPYFLCSLCSQDRKSTRLNS